MYVRYQVQPAEAATTYAGKKRKGSGALIRGLEAFKNQRNVSLSSDDKKVLDEEEENTVEMRILTVGVTSLNGLQPPKGRHPIASDNKMNN